MASSSSASYSPDYSSTFLVYWLQFTMYTKQQQNQIILLSFFFVFFLK